MATLVDLSDYVEFLERQESISGVQRVVRHVAPLLIQSGAGAVILDRRRGCFVPLTEQEIDAVLGDQVVAGTLESARAASALLERSRETPPLDIDSSTLLVFLGAVWISDALMLAARHAHAEGARCVYLIYDLTPVLGAGHTPTVVDLFRRYLALTVETGSAVPAISWATRRDYEEWCRDQGVPAPIGQGTGLPAGVAPSTSERESAPPWPRPYALMVGTVEGRKNHRFALDVWRRLIERHGAENVPDLVCIGRLGWNADEFLAEYLATGGLDGKVSLLRANLTDKQLADFYEHAEFTFYPSQHEGWGLPVTESLVFGKVPIVARNSSLIEAGGDFASYATTSDVSDFIRAIESDGFDQIQRSEREDRIRSSFRDRTWQEVADTIQGDIDKVRSMKPRSQHFPAVELGREYSLGTRQNAPLSDYADQVYSHLNDAGRTPLLGQSWTDDHVVTDAAIIGPIGSPQTWGLEVRPGVTIGIRVTRPVDGDLAVLLATRSMPGTVDVEVSGPGGPVVSRVALGSVVTLPLGSGSRGAPAQATLAVTNATDSLEGFLGIRSFVVLRADDLETQNITLRAAANALRTELDHLLNSRAWKFTAPLRRLKKR